MCGIYLTGGEFFMTILEDCKKIKGSSPKEAENLAMKLVSRVVIDNNQFDIEAVKEGLGEGYYDYILTQLRNKFHIGKKK